MGGGRDWDCVCSSRVCSRLESDMKWRGEEGAAVLDGNKGMLGGGGRDRLIQVGWSQVMEPRVPGWGGCV